MPIWIGATSGNALRRAAQWNGWVVYTVNPDDKVLRGAGEVAKTLATICQHREVAGLDQDGYEVVVTGVSQVGEDVAAYRDIGAMWWLETLHGMRFDSDTLLVHVQAEPPK